MNFGSVANQKVPAFPIHSPLQSPISKASSDRFTSTKFARMSLSAFLTAHITGVDLIMTATTTDNPTTSGSPDQLQGKGAPLCWKFTSAGTWVKYPAPWRREDPGVFFIENAKSVVFDSSFNPAFCPDEPGVGNRLQIYTFGVIDPSSPAAVLICEFSGYEAGELQTRSSQWYFVCEWPGIARLAMEFEKVLRFPSGCKCLTTLSKAQDQ
jgi:hypothetical protein